MHVRSCRQGRTGLPRRDSEPFGQCRCHGRRKWQSWDQCGLDRVIQIRLAWPHRLDDVIAGVELMVPRAIGPIEEITLGVGPPGRGLLGITIITSSRSQRGRGSDGLGENPMHSVADHRCAVPISGVDKAVRTIDRPTIGHCAIEESFGSRQQPVRRVGQGCLEMQQQSRPLQSMPDGGSIRLELIIRTITVVLELRLPIPVEVLGDAPGMWLGKLQRHTPTDTKGGRAQSMITCDISSGEQSLDPVHVGVHAAVVVEFCEGSVPGVDEHACVIVEEPPLPDVE